MDAMALQTFQRTVNNTATLLASAAASSDVGDYKNVRVGLINVSATPTTVYIGPAGVTTGNGARWIVEAGRTLSLELEPGEEVYGIVASGTQSIDVIVGGR
jgi:hypothetical protein